MSQAQARCTLVILVMTLMACSGGGGTSASSSPSASSNTQGSSDSSSSSAPIQPDFLNGDYACSLITQAEMSIVFERPSRPPEPNGGRLLASDGGDTSNCNVTSEDGVLVAQYTIFRGHTADVTQTHWANIQGGQTFEPVPGVGDEALFLLNSVPIMYALHQFETLEIDVIDTTVTQPGAVGADTKTMSIEAARIIAARMGSGASSTSECFVGDDGLVPPGQRLSADDLAFEASQDEGNYSGTWNNDTFGTSGTVDADVTFDLNARTATIKFRFQGDTLGIQGDGLAETAVIEVDRPVAHVRSNTLGDLVITRPLGFGCPTRPVSATADQASNSSLSGLSATLDVGSATVDATFDITYPNGKTSTGRFVLRHQ